jgi:AraC-like DNA-binding protein
VPGLRAAASSFKRGTPLALAAATSGFSDAAHMTRTFRRMFGSAPPPRGRDLVQQKAAGATPGQMVPRSALQNCHGSVSRRALDARVAATDPGRSPCHIDYSDTHSHTPCTRCAGS